MAIDLDLLKQARNIVFDATEQISGRSRNQIGRGTSFDDLGLAAEDIIRLFLAIRGSLPPGLIKFTQRAFLGTKTVGDVLDLLVLKPRRTTIEDLASEGAPDDPIRRKIEEVRTAIEAASPPKKAKPKPARGGIRVGEADLDVEIEISRPPQVKRKGLATASDPPPAAPAWQPQKERQISIWIGEENSPAERALAIGQTYLLSFKVGAAVKASFVGGPEAEVPAADIPAGGLPTTWRVIAHSAELTAGTSDTKVDVTTVDGLPCWSGQFDLHIPESGDSAIPQLNVKPLKDDPRIDVIVTARGENYRRFQILLKASAKPDSKPAGPPRIEGEQVFARAMEIGLKPPHEWTTPWDRLSISVIEGPKALAQGHIRDNEVYVPPESWGQQTQVDGPHKNVRLAAEALRVAFEAHLDNIDVADLADRLRKWNNDGQGWGVPYWPSLSFFADAAHEKAWRDMAVSPQLRALAFYGGTLFDAFFPKGGRLRAALEDMRPGARLNISWLPLTGAGFISHVPWGLMYLGDVPQEGQPVDPLGFLGMRFRLAYDCHQDLSRSRSLGAFQSTYRTHFLYWAGGDEDITLREAQWQQGLFKGWDNQIFVPNPVPGTIEPARSRAARTELLRLLATPAPAPTSVLYLFCQSDTEAGNTPILRFGDTNDAVNLVKQMDLGTSALAGRPLIFANACGTAGAETYQANLLEGTFFKRECRAYLGTEIRVPIALASRFAAIFFHFLYRKLDPAPMAAGEAVAQTRLFLWTHYRNLGGLFYCYINQYDLYVADKSEIESMRA